MTEDKTVYLDTSFLLRLLVDEGKLHDNAVEYYKYFLQEKYAIKVSTIAMAEFCVKNDKDILPYDQIQIVPFNPNHAFIAGKFMNIIYTARKNNEVSVSDRKIIPNDVKIFAQAYNDNATWFASSDDECKKLMEYLNKHADFHVEHLSLSIPFCEWSGVLLL